jgi:uncharacterized protein YlxW (UPF0749 family)
MTEERPQGRPGPDGPDDDAVPHPFGPGRLGERPAEVEAAAEPEPEPSTSDEPVEVEAAAEPESPIEDEVEDTAEPEELIEPEELTEPEDAAEPAEPAEPEPEPEPGDAAEPEPARSKVAITARRRRDPLAAALIGVLTLLLGFAFAVQVRNVGNDQALSGAREEDLVRILDDLNAREERLREQISDQRTALQQLTSSDSQSATALEEARKRAEAIGILNGTVPAQGPGLTMTIRDPDDAVRVADILDAIQELRGAGAETMQIDGVRVGVSTAVTGDPGGLMIDGRPITTPYEFVVIGDPQNMETAMNIPGGVVPRINSRGGSVTIEPADEVVVDALRPLDTPQYASPATGN